MKTEYIILSENRGDYITHLEFKPDGKFDFLGGPADEAIRYTIEEATEIVENLGRGFAVESAARYELRIQLDRESLCWTGIEWGEESPKLYNDIDIAREDIPEAIEALKPGMGWASSDRPSILVMDHDDDGGIVEEIYLDTFK